MKRNEIIKQMRLKAGRLGYMLIVPDTTTKPVLLIEGKSQRLVHADMFDAMREFLQV
jgi:hypothetical protein